MPNKNEVIQEIEKLPESLLREVWDFAQFLQTKAIKTKPENALLSETSLGKDWLKPEEDEAWQSL